MIDALPTFRQYFDFFIVQISSVLNLHFHFQRHKFYSLQILHVCITVSEFTVYPYIGECSFDQPIRITE